MIWQAIKDFFGWGQPELTPAEAAVLDALYGRAQHGIYLWDLSAVLPDFQDDELEIAAIKLERRGLIQSTGTDIYDKFLLPVYDD